LADLVGSDSKYWAWPNAACFLTDPFSAIDESVDAPPPPIDLDVLVSLSGPNPRSKFVATLQDLAQRAKKAIAELPPDKGGQVRDEAFFGFVIALAALYQSVTGKTITTSGQEPKVWHKGGRYGGRFLRFVETIYRHIPFDEFRERHPTTTLRTPKLSGLGKAVQRVLDVRRKRLRPQPSQEGSEPENS
jgi:hypothetical protein